MKKTKLLSMAFTLLFAFVLSACGGGGGSASTSADIGTVATYTGTLTRMATAWAKWGNQGTLMCDITGVIHIHLHSDGSVIGDSATAETFVWSSSANGENCAGGGGVDIIQGTHGNGQFTVRYISSIGEGTISGTYDSNALSGSGDRYGTGYFQDNGSRPFGYNDRFFVTATRVIENPPANDSSDDDY